MTNRFLRLLTWAAIAFPVLFSCNKVPVEKQGDTLATLTGRFADPPAEYRAIPFWVWNEKISPEGIDFQLEKFKEAGIGGVFVHPRPGLMTEYLSEEWHGLFDHAVRKGKELGMQVWIYDENSYPSGFAGGHVPAQMPDSYRHGAGLALEIQPVLKTVPADTVEVILRKEGDQFTNLTKEAPNLTGQKGPWYVYRNTWPGKSWWYGGFSYVDLLYPGVTQKFLEITMKGYEERNRADFGNTLAGIFTDEPNLEAALSDGAIMRWTPDLWEAFLQRWGYDLRTSLPSLTDETGNWRKVRHDYYELLLELFINRWSKPWYEYCEANNLKWTGHYWEHGWPVPTDGIDELAFYTWHQMPGVDMLGFRLDSAGLGGQFGNDRAIRELLSAANQTGSKRTMSETYGGGGWDMPFREQKRLADWQFALGVNCVNLCLSFYSLNGVRKFDYPLSFTYHEPWWKEYRWMADYLGRISMAMASGEQINKTIVLQPNTSAWMYFSRQKDNTRLAEIRDGFKKFVYLLEQQQVEYDLGSENVIRQMGRVAGNRLVVGQRDYDLVVIPAEMDNIDASTLALLSTILGNGGRVLAFRETIPLIDGESSGAVAELAGRYGRQWTRADGLGDPAARELLVRPEFSIADHTRNGSLYHQRRIFADGQLLFVANTNKTRPAEVTVTMTGNYASRLDALNGRIYRYPATRKKNGIEFNIRLEPAGSALFAITGSRQGEPEERPLTGGLREAESTGPMRVQRESDNVLVMDYVDLKTPLSEKKDIHFMEAAIGLYKEYGLELGNPWQHKIQYGKKYLEMDNLFIGKPGFEATYRFTLKEDISPDVMSRIRAVAERPGLWEVSINSHPVSPSDGEYWIDRDFAVYAIGKYLQHGENILTLKAPRMHILAEIMPVYLLGDFMVKPAVRGFEVTGGTFAATGSWSREGMPFYAGKVSYSQTFNPVPGKQLSYRVAMPEWNGAVAEVSVNGQPAGIIAFPPDELEVTPFMKPGENEITVTVCGSLKNTFGPFHDNSDNWLIGPHSWIRAPGHQPPGQSYFLNDYGLKEPFRLVVVNRPAGVEDQANQDKERSKDQTGRNGANVDNPLKLWYIQPAERWLEALPIGNGRLGAMVFGGVETERIALNETTLWSGAPSDKHENPESAETFRKVRELFREQKYEEAQPLIGNLLGRRLNYGTNLPAGDLLLVQGGINGPVKDYRRELDLDQALATVSFTAGGVRFNREVLASHPDGILLMRLTADRPGSIGLTLRYDGGKLPNTVKAEASGILLIQGKAVEKKHSDGTCGVNFQARCQILNKGGTISALNDCLVVKGADTVTILIALNTDFTGIDPAIVGEKQIHAAREKGWAKVKMDHIADHQALFRRVALDLGPAPVSGQTTDIRWKAMANGKKDAAMEALFFQYGRYLIIAGSREDSPLPMHLQGIWNDHLAADMGWTCDFHLDINTEQNYWPTETANLSECGLPLFRFIETLQEPGHRTAMNSYGIDKGWVCHVVTNAWGFTAPGWGGGWGLHVTGGIWIASHLWEHYLFTGDRTFLATTTYPVLKGAAEFFLEYLFTDPKTGYLITGPSVSPEMGGETEPGSTHDLALIRDLFTNCIEACKTLGKDAAFKVRLEQALAKLPPYKIGFNGQIQEWLNKDDGGVTNHRHTSHLVGLFPLAQITPRTTPELAKAAERSLQIRMQDPKWEDVEWSAGNSICYYARLGNGRMARKSLVNLITADADANLMTYSRGGIAGAEQNIFVLDGNTSGTAGIAEMLLQSHSGEIELLPALPEAWSSGSVKGLRARGGYTVDIDWKNGKVTNYTIFSSESREVKIRTNGETKTIFSKSFSK